ncbi:MAG: hypothetical protein AAGG81_07025, partial [Chlamydiota bacterium]
QKRKTIKLFILDPMNIDTLNDDEIEIYWAYFYGIRQIFNDDMTRLEKKLQLKTKETKQLLKALIQEKSLGFVSKGESNLLLPLIAPIAEMNNQSPFQVNHLLSYDNFLHNLWDCEDDELTGQLYHFFIPIWDTSKEQQAQLMAVNIPLFGNYRRWDECSINIFFENDSIESGDHNLKKPLKIYYKEKGLDPSIIDLLWKVAKKKLKKAKVHTGVLYQLYHTGDLNHDAFVSVDFGVPIIHIEPFEAVCCEKLPKNNKGVDIQVRLVMSNEQTLNPEGGLRAIRYDNTPPEVSANIIQEMRTILRNSMRSANR